MLRTVWNCMHFLCLWGVGFCVFAKEECVGLDFPVEPSAFGQRISCLPHSAVLAQLSMRKLTSW